MASEPSITVTSDQVIAVAAPAGHTGATAITQGGFVWVSNDGGNTFRLRLDPNQVDTSSVRPCSCDTDIMSRNGELLALTMYYFVQPFFNVAIAGSTDSGVTWQTRSTMSATLPGVDRPWLSPGPGNDLVLTYGSSEIVGGAPDSEPLYAFQDIGLQKSTDSGKTWSPPVLVATADTTHGGGMLPLKTRSISPSTILVPLVQGDSSHRDADIVAVSHDGGQTFHQIQLAGPHDWYADFDLSLDALPNGRVVAAWTEPVNGTQRLHVRQSTDSGDTWGPTQVVGMPGTILQPWVALRPDGMLAIAYYGTDLEGSILNMSKDTPWEPRVALFLSNQTAQPSAIANLSQSAAYHGILCNKGPACPDDNFVSPMREFLSAQWSPNGTLFVAFTDATERGANNDHGRITVTSLQVR
jgi:hypothetical protein